MANHDCQVQRYKSSLGLKRHLLLATTIATTTTASAVEVDLSGVARAACVQGKRAAYNSSRRDVPRLDGKSSTVCRDSPSRELRKEQRHSCRRRGRAAGARGPLLGIYLANCSHALLSHSLRPSLAGEGRLRGHASSSHVTWLSLAFPRRSSRSAWVDRYSPAEALARGMSVPGTLNWPSSLLTIVSGAPRFLMGNHCLGLLREKPAAALLCRRGG